MCYETEIEYKNENVKNFKWQNFFQTVESLMNTISKLTLLKKASSWIQEKKVIIPLKTSCAPARVSLMLQKY